MRRMKRVIPHLLFILSGIFITFLILDDYNPTMDFINNHISIKLLWGFCLLSLLNSLLMMMESRKDNPESKNTSNHKAKTDNNNDPNHEKYTDN